MIGEKGEVLFTGSFDDFHAMMPLSSSIQERTTCTARPHRRRARPPQIMDGSTLYFALHCIGVCSVLV